MSCSKRSRYSRSPSPYKRHGGSVSRSMSRSRSRSRSISRSRSRRRNSSDVENPGNNLYVTGLSPRITKKELEKHFEKEGRVTDVHLVVDPWTRESRGFGFVTMDTVEGANRCIKYLNHSVIEGRVITVEKAKRRRGRTPTPGRYLGLRTIRVRRGSPSYSPYTRDRSWTPSPRYSSERDRSRSYSPYYRRRRSYSPYNSRRRSYSRSHSPYSRSPVIRHYRSHSYYNSRCYSPDDGYHQRHRYNSPDYGYHQRHRYHSLSVSPQRHCYHSCSVSPSVSPRERRSSRRIYSVTPERRRRYFRSISPGPRKSLRRSPSRSISPRWQSSRSRSRWGSSRREYSRGRYPSSSSESRNVSASSRSLSRSVTPRSRTPSY